MALEWLRRNDPKFAEHLKTFLFTDGPITGDRSAMDRQAASEASEARRRRQSRHRQPAQDGAGDE